MNCKSEYMLMLIIVSQQFQLKQHVYFIEHTTVVLEHLVLAGITTISALVYVSTVNIIRYSLNSII